MTKRILSGMQPSSHLTLGNYLGALKNWVSLQDEAGTQALYMVADLHAITQDYDPSSLAQATREIAAAYIAGGLDPNKADIFVQSQIPAHSELMWLLSTMSQMGKLERMTQFKDKAGKNAERASLGLFAYPVLMAADILIYKATHVPVGDDQKQHLELSREIASTFNTRYDTEFFPQPEPVIVGGATRVMSLRDGAKKMSKSDVSDMSRINLTDDADLIAKKIKKAKTDVYAELPSDIAGFEGRPEVKNLFTIYGALSGLSMDEVLARFGGKTNQVFKTDFTEVAVGYLSPITGRMNDLLKDPASVDAILRAGTEKASEIAAQNVCEVRKIMGLWS